MIEEDLHKCSFVIGNYPGIDKDNRMEANYGICGREDEPIAREYGSM